MDMKRFFLYAIVIAALALAGCGSDGNGGMTAMDPDPGPTDAEKIEAAQMEADEAVTAAQAAVDKAKALPHADDPDTAEQIMAAETALAAAQAAKAEADADDVTVADAEAAAAKAEEEQGKAEAAYAMAKTASDVAAMRANDARVAAATKAAGTKMTAIMAEAAQTVDAGLGGSDPNGDETEITTPTDTEVYTLAIERSRSATTVKITDTNPAFDGNDNTDTSMRDEDEPQFEKAMDMGMANGFAGSMHVRVNSDDDEGKVEEVVVVRTDIDAPKATPFAMVTNADPTLSQALTVRKDEEPVDGDNPADSISVGAGTDNANLPKIMSAAFGRATDGTLTQTFDSRDVDAGTNDTAEPFETSGTYNGAMGTYTCGGNNDCTVTVNDKGEVTAISTGWVFTPNEGATSDVADTSYLAYGFWLKRTTKDGETTYNEVEAFTGGNVSLTDTTNLGNVAGTATYTGNSTGVYVKNVTDTQGAITSATSGVYSADVTLNASFGGGKIGVDDQFRIDGEVTDFTLQHGEENDWMVKLESADFSGVENRGPDTPAGSNHTNVFSSTTIGDSAADKGSWNGGFYGVATEITEGETTPRNAPPHVLGEFNANFTDGAVLGAFGADKMEDSQ